MRTFFEFIKAESKEFRWPLVVMAVVAGMLNGVAIAVAIGTAKKLEPGNLNFAELLLFAFCIATFWITKEIVLNRTTSIVEGIVRDVRLRIMRKLRNTSLLVFESMDRGRIYAALSVDAISISVSSGVIINATSAVVMLGFVFVYIGILSMTALAITAVCICGAVYMYLIKGRSVHEEMREAARREGEFFDNLNGLLDGFKEFKLNRAKSEDFFGEELFELVSSTATLRIKAGKAMNSAVLIGQTFLFFTVGGVLFLLPNLNPADIAIVVPVIAVVLFAAGPIGDVVVAIPALAKARASIDSIHRLEAEVDAKQSEVETFAAMAEVAPEEFESLRCEDFAFQYPAKGTRPFVLQPFSFEVARGEIVFVVGGNGSGKSTFLKLMTGLYSPKTGERYLNDNLVHEGTIGAYRDLFAPIFGDFHLFPRLLGVGDYDPKVVNRLLTRMELVGITDIKDGRITNLNLSTGQKKRLALILAYLDDKPVYVFDEWAADQDPVFRRFFYETLLQEMREQGKTVIAVTHDDHYFHTADRILKMEYGRLLPEETVGADTHGADFS